MSLTQLPEAISHLVLGSGRFGLDIFREASASLLTYELYPLGLVGKSVPTLKKPWKRERKIRHLPILFIHGVFHNRSAFAWIKNRLVSEGWNQFREIDLLTSVHHVPKLAEQVEASVRQLLEEYQTPQIDIIAHSLGGIIARYYVQEGGGDGVVRNLITLGSPHGGTLWSRYSVLPHLRELAPQSPFIRQLNAAPPPRNTRAISISGEFDVMVRPRESGFWPGVRNVHLRRVGHAGLLYSQRVHEIILANLTPPSDDFTTNKP